MSGVRQSHRCGDFIHQEPKFLGKRVHHYYSERLEQIWRGRSGRRELMSRAPTVADVRLFNNDYLAISNHPEITQSQINSLQQFGNGPMMSQVFFTNEAPQYQFEREMANYMRAEATMVCQSGWSANVGLLQSIADADTPVYIDMLAHMSLWEGIVSAGATARVFRHNDVNHLERLIQQYGEGIVVVDSVYSTNGDIAPLAEITEIAMRYGCIMLVDESHSLGTHGQEGAGLVVELGLEKQVHFRTSSLAKAFVGRGGIIAGPKRLIDYICHEARPVIFSSAVLPTDIAAFSSALAVIRKEEWRREKMRANANYLREGLAQLGYNVTASKSQIISLEAGAEAQALLLRDALESREVFGAIFFPPATPKMRASVRFSVDAGITPQDLERALQVCHAIRDEVDMKSWRSTQRLRLQAKQSILAE